MDCQRELDFLRELFQRNRVSVRLIDAQSFKDATEDEGFLDNRALFMQLYTTAEAETLYKVTDAFDRNYRVLLLPETEPHTLLCVGPFLSAPLSTSRLLAIGEENGLSPQKHSYRYLTEYYAALPTVPENSPLAMALNIFCEKIWHTRSFHLKDITKNPISDTPFSKSMRNLDANDALINKKAVEHRYAFENEMIRAVSLGQPHAEARFRTAFSNTFFEKRASDPLRNAKNYGVIMNTLLRKAAETGGVHPVYIDQTSSEFAEKIENLSLLSGVPNLMCEMFRTYCRLVRRHALGKFSPVVQKSILIINADLSADVSPSSLAKTQGVSLEYLSTVFRKETGKTLTEYIRERRIEYAEYLLKTTNLQIQTVALHCGILDAQYFSKLFKAQIGQTPLQYRRSFHIKPI